jgi:DNA-binding MarR family transcriptional regulator
MNDAAKTLAQFKKANKLMRLAFRKNGPKSFKRGQGALLKALLENDGALQKELTKTLGMNRSSLKDIVKKAQRNGYVTIENVDEPRTYRVNLTDLGRSLADKREKANDAVAEDVLSCLSADEVAQLDAISEKIIVSLKEKGICGKKKGYKVRRKHRRH